MAPKMKRINRIGATLLLGIGALSTSALVIAQETARNETVANRARPEVDALGLTIGGYLLFPELGVEGRTNDNIYATDVAEVSDSIFVTAPALNFRSNWGKHALNFGADAELLRQNSDYYYCSQH